MSSVPLTAAEVPGPTVSEPFAPAGTPINARLINLVSTALSTAGEPFSAEVVTPVIATDGSVLVEAGAPLYGHVDQISIGGAAPRLTLAFDAINTKKGPAFISAILAQTPRFTFGGGIKPAPSGEGYVRSNVQIALLPGTELRLVLARPLALPSTSR